MLAKCGETGFVILRDRRFPIYPVASREDIHIWKAHHTTSTSLQEDKQLCISKFKNLIIKKINVIQAYNKTSGVFYIFL